MPQCLDIVAWRRITCVCVDALPIGTNVPVSGTFVQINALLIFVGLLTLGTQTLEGTD